MARVPKTSRKEHETPRRVRFRHLIELGESKSHAAHVLSLVRSTAKRWIHERDSDWRTRKESTRKLRRPPIILDIKVEEMIKWMTSHFNRRAMPL